MSDVIYYARNHRPNDKYRLLHRNAYDVRLESNSGVQISVTEEELLSEFTKTTMSASREELVAGVPTARKHAHYFKDVSKFDEMDTYLFCRVWKVEDYSGALHHAIKKIIDAGKRGNKDKLKDIKEAKDALNRYLEIEEMFSGMD